MPSTRISKHLRNSSQATPSASVFPLPPLKASNEWLAALHYALLRPREQLILSLRRLRPGMPFTVAGSIFSGNWGQTGRSLKLVPAHCLAASLFWWRSLRPGHPNKRRFSRLPFWLLDRRILFPRAENRRSTQSPDRRPRRSGATTLPCSTSGRAFSADVFEALNPCHSECCRSSATRNDVLGIHCG
jgi:hypothetical protein